MYLSYSSARNVSMSTKVIISPNWSTEFDLYKLSLFRVPQSFLFKFSSLTKFLRFFGWAKRSLRLLDLFSPALYLLLKKFTGLPNGLFIWWVSLENKMFKFKGTRWDTRKIKLKIRKKWRWVILWEQTLLKWNLVVERFLAQIWFLCLLIFLIIYQVSRFFCHR